MFPQVTFNHPLLAHLAVLAVPIILGMSGLIARWQRGFVRGFSRPTVVRSKRTAAVLFSLAVALAALAAAEPKIAVGDRAVSRTFNAVIVLDVSRSMAAQDTPDGRTRLELAIAALERVFETYPDGKFGLVLFTKGPVGYQLTNDHEALLYLMRYQIDRVHARGEGSNLPLALKDTARVVRDSDLPVEVVLIVSDGGGAGSTTYNIALDKAVENLRETGVRIAAAGVGDLIPVRIPVYEDGELIGYHAYRGTGIVATTSLREDILRAIVRNGGGSYQRIEEEETLVEMARDNGWDTQPVTQEGEVTLTAYPAAGSLILVFLLLLARRRKG